MNLTLMSAVPHKRFDFAPSCEDGRGGWTFSQFGSDRYVANPAQHAIRLGLAIWVSPHVPNDYVCSTTLTATFADEVIGVDTLDWRCPNTWGYHHRDGSVYEWLQEVDTPIVDSGLITISLAVKLHSQPDTLQVAGSAMVHTTLRDTSESLVDADKYAASLTDPRLSTDWWPEVSDNHPIHRSDGGWLSRKLARFSPPPGDR
ncbi:MAG: hypothetical protein AAF745_13290 [Planctomycetota bacterium]